MTFQNQDSSKGGYFEIDATAAVFNPLVLDASQGDHNHNQEYMRQSLVSGRFVDETNSE